MDDCLFCNIVKGTIPSTKVYEDEYTFAFKDINPQMPVHILVIPKTHISSVAELNENNSIYAARCLETVSKVAKQEGLDNGYRVVSNVGNDAGQTVHHLHFHILGGNKMTDHMA